MAYNGFGYGNYGSYFQQQQQQNQQQNAASSGGSSQRYQGQQNAYSPYYQTSSASYGQQAQGEQQQQPQGQQHAQQYQSKPTEASSYPQSYYQQPQQQQQYAQRTTAESGNGLYSMSRQYSASTSGTNQATSAATSNAPQYQYGQGSTAQGDTSALGNLAYVSSLGRSSPATSQPRYSQPANEMTSYSSASPVYQTHQHQQAAYDRDQAARASAPKQSSPYLSQQKAPKGPPQQAQQRQAAVHQYHQNQPGHSRVSSASSQNRYPSPLQNAISRPPVSQNVNVNQTNAQQPQLSRSNSLKSPPVRTSSVPSAQQQPYGVAPTQSVARQSNDKMQSPNLAQPSFSATGGAQRPQRQETGPITVEPSQVFDQVEYQRRKAAAEAEAAAAQKAQAESARLARQQAENEAAKKVAEEQEAKAEAERKKAEVEAATRAAEANQRPKADSQSRDQIQAEMKVMIEKMREYKAQDPAAFTEIWEQFKKMQGQPVRTPSLSAASQSMAGGKTPTETAGSATADQSANSPSFPPNAGGSGDRGDGSGLQDRGKFPAMRRKTRNDKGTLRGKESATSGKAAPVPGATQVPPIAQAPYLSQTKAPAGSQRPGPTQFAPQTPMPGQYTGYDPTGADTMRLAMARYHNTPTPGPSSSNQSSPQPGSAGVSAHSGVKPLPGSQKAQANGTIWPEKDKAKLAAAAKQSLESYPPNQSKKISASLIHQFLNRNPSYDQLCELLLKEGFQLDRSQFARTLLAVVPNEPASTASKGPVASVGEPPFKRKRGRPNQDGSQPSTPSDQMPTVNTIAQNIQSWQSSQNATIRGFQKPLVFKEPLTKNSPPLNAQGQGRSPSVSSQHSSAPEYQDFHNRMRAMSGALAQGTAISNAQAKSKQEMARKRTFNDLVDMTRV